MVQCRSQAVGQAFDFQARVAEIQKQAESQMGGFEIIGALHPMDVV
jgi:hypothetical protein